MNLLQRIISATTRKSPTMGHEQPQVSLDQERERVTVQCPACKRQVTFLKPLAAIRGEVTCRRCGHTFDWAPQRPEVVELRFRCSQTGKRFVIAFGRESATTPLTIRYTEVGGKSLVDCGYRGMAEHQYELSLPAAKSYSSTDFCFDGFACPCCKFIAATGGAGFFVCGRCGENVCSSRVTVDESGLSVARCYSACGYSGVLNETVLSLQGHGTEAKALMSHSKRPLPVVTPAAADAVMTAAKASGLPQLRR